MFKKLNHVSSMSGMMVKSIKEFQDELGVLRKEMYNYGETADAELVASWLDRLVISLDKLCNNLDLMSVGADVMSECCCGGSPCDIPAKSSAKKHVKVAHAKKPVHAKHAKKPAKAVHAKKKNVHAKKKPKRRR
ncbi:hypothetical protein KKF81_06365 [Candidatus Micrarchaeota archaeon]|nr:hypothetical protein [Candidatus Micrarchaeota archaeon]MBU1166553.1 hypothetical protein [Candidatus Micrarchaeota archaeon]MBU1887563.1 hypothetical protein [Candidatus Micrarchaeota archaeon]